MQEMPLSPYQIKDRLLQVIEEDGRVSNLRAALEIITMLESITITKKELEDTRLGKYINLVRKAARDVTLQKRAKKLIRTWQQIASSLQPNINTSDMRSSPKPSPCAVPKKNANVAKRPPPHISTVNGNVGRERTDGKPKRILDSQKRSAHIAETDGGNVKLKTDAKFRKNLLKPNMTSSSRSRTSSPKATNQSRPSDTSRDESLPSSFTCRTNGLKLKIMTLPSTPPSKETLTWNDPEPKPRRKRKREDDLSPPDSLDSTRTSDEVASSSLTSSSLSPSSANSLGAATYMHDFTSVVPVERTAPLRDAGTKHSMAAEGDKEIAKTAKNTTAIANPNGGRLGIDGCLGGDGSWFSWSDSIFVQRPTALRTEADPLDLLSILPYVELE